MFERIKRWLRGTFVCHRCDETFHIMTFGYGFAYCPDCYDGGQFLYFDCSFILNRLMMRIYGGGKREFKYMTMIRKREVEI